MLFLFLFLYFLFFILFFWVLWWLARGARVGGKRLFFVSGLAFLRGLAPANWFCAEVSGGTGCVRGWAQLSSSFSSLRFCFKALLLFKVSICFFRGGGEPLF